MTLYHKALLVMLAATFTVAIAALAVAELLLMPALLHYEQHGVQERLETLNSALQRTVTELDGTAADYAMWDPTYDFMKGRSGDYPRVAFSETAFENYDIQLVMLISPDDRVLLQQQFHERYGPPVGTNDVSAIRAITHEFTATIGERAPARGVVAAPGAPFVVSMRPVMRSSGKGEVAGMLVMARRIDANEISEMEQSVHSSVMIQPHTVHEATAVYWRGDPGRLILQDGSVAWMERSDRTVLGDLLIGDLMGRPGFILRLTTDRTLYHRSRRLIWGACIAVSGVAIAMGLWQLWFLNSLVFSRLRAASRTVRQITAGKDLSIRLKIQRDDELGLLARTVNTMLDQLERSRNELLRLHAAAQFDAEHDALTGLKNRRAIVETLQAELSRAFREQTKVAVLLADIDDFKQVNDRFGHAVGDSVIKHVAATLANELRPYDSVGRYGGEEFLIVVPGVNQLRGVEFAERLRRRVEEASLLQEIVGKPMTVSIGVAVTSGDTPAETIIDTADSSMYTAKAAGRNRVVMRQELLLIDAETHVAHYAGA